VPPDVAGAELATEAGGSEADGRGSDRPDVGVRVAAGLDVDARADAAGALVMVGVRRGWAAGGAAG
jgi:hypothetical protein